MRSFFLIKKFQFYNSIRISTKIPILRSGNKFLPFSFQFLVKKKKKEKGRRRSRDTNIVNCNIVSSNSAHSP